MSKRARDNRPYIKPVTRVELSETNIKLRWIAIAVLLSIAVVAIGYGFSLALRTEPGWTQITPLSEEVNCSSDFVLMFDFGVGDINPTAAHKKLEALYGDLTVSAYRLFSPEAVDTDNLYHLNSRINTPVTVDPALYQALEQIVSSGNRFCFLAPVQELYDPVYLSANDAEAALYDPMKDPDRAALVRETASYCADPEMVRLELLGDNQVQLHVAQEYITFAREYGIEVFLDLGWMKNAFIADYIADALAAEGFSAGYLASKDGFTRNLYRFGKRFSQNIYHRVGTDVYLPASLEYSGPMSLVSLRNYPVSDQEKWQYYAYQDGTLTSVYLDPADGMCRTSIDGLTVYSREKGCAEILLKVAPIFISETFDAQKLERLATESMESVRCQGTNVVCTESASSVRILDSGYSIVTSTVK